MAMYGGGSIVDISRPSGSGGQGAGGLASGLAAIQKDQEMQEGKRQDQAFLTKMAKAKAAGATPEQLAAIAAAPVAPIGLLSRITGKARPGPIQQSYMGQILQNEMERSDPRYQAELGRTKAQTESYERANQPEAIAEKPYSSSAEYKEKMARRKALKDQHDSLRDESGNLPDKNKIKGERIQKQIDQINAEFQEKLGVGDETDQGLGVSDDVKIDPIIADRQKTGPSDALIQAAASGKSEREMFDMGLYDTAQQNDAPTQLKAITDGIASGIDKFKGIFNLDDVADLQSIVEGGDANAIQDALGRIFELLKGAGKGIGGGIAAMGDAADAAATGATLSEFLGR